jgi:hypothetical protein
MAPPIGRCARFTEPHRFGLTKSAGDGGMTRQLLLGCSAFCLLTLLAALDARASTAASPMAKDMCSRQDIETTATGYVSDSVCGVAGMSITTHAEITRDFNSAYTVRSTAHTEHGPTGVPRDTTCPSSCRSNSPPLPASAREGEARLHRYPHRRA